MHACCKYSDFSFALKCEYLQANPAVQSAVKTVSSSESLDCQCTNVLVFTTFWSVLSYHCSQRVTLL